MARKISPLTEVPFYPVRKDPQERFDTLIKAAVDGGATLTRELNATFIPAVNGIAGDVESAQSSVAADKEETKAKAGEAAASAQAAAGSAAAAKASQNAAKTSETNAKTSETNAAQARQDAAASADMATKKAGEAGTSAGEASKSAEAALASKNAAKTSETNAKTSETAAKASETKAKTSETAAAGSETKAKASETNAKASETAAANSASSALAAKNAAAASETNALTAAGRAETAADNAEAIVGGNFALSARKIVAGAGLSGGGDLTADRTLSVKYGTAAGTSCQGNDARLTDARAPKAHKASHKTGGADALTPADIGAVAMTDGRLTDARAPKAHASTHKHGGADEIATATPTANAIPKAGADGKIDKAWIPQPRFISSEWNPPSQVNLNKPFSLDVSIGSNFTGIEPVEASVVLSSEQTFSTEKYTNVFEDSVTLTPMRRLIFESEQMIPGVYSFNGPAHLSKKNGTVVISCNGNCILISRDKGKTWGKPVPFEFNTNMIRTDSNGTWIIASPESKGQANAGRIAVSHDDCKTWKYILLSLQYHIIDVCPDEKGFWLMSLNYSSKYLYSTSYNNGDSWSEPTSLINITGNHIATDGKGVWNIAQYNTLAPSKIAMSIDNLKTFTYVNIDIVDIYSIVWGGKPGWWILTTSNGYVRISTDNGKSWDGPANTLYTQNGLYAYSGPDVDGNIFLSGYDVTRFNFQQMGKYGVPSNSDDYTLKKRNIASDGNKTWIFSNYFSIRRMLVESYFNSTVESKITSAASGQKFTLGLRVKDSEGNTIQKQANFTIV